MDDERFNHTLHIANCCLGQALEDLLIEELITESSNKRLHLRDIRNQLESCSTILKSLQRKRTEALELSIQKI